jgi:hypothetical protein
MFSELCVHRRHEYQRGKCLLRQTRTGIHAGVRRQPRSQRLHRRSWRGNHRCGACDHDDRQQRASQYQQFGGHHPHGGRIGGRNGGFQHQRGRRAHHLYGQRLGQSGQSNHHRAGDLEFGRRRSEFRHGCYPRHADLHGHERARYWDSAWRPEYLPQQRRRDHHRCQWKRRLLGKHVRHDQSDHHQRKPDSDNGRDRKRGFRRFDRQFHR